MNAETLSSSAGAGDGADGFTALVQRLSRQSVDKHSDAYADVDWDHPALRIDPADQRWDLPAEDPLGGTSWYQEQPAEVRARIGLTRVAVQMRTGWEFENVLQRGLLTVAYALPNGRAEFRYLHHEVIEESQHTMMFQEFVHRSDLDVRGLPRVLKAVAELAVVPLSRVFPPLFFLFVLGGEDPIDHLQRRRLKSGELHPLVEVITRIHVTEEARHLSFARHYLKAQVPRLGWFRRTLLGLSAPLLLGVMARQMLIVTPAFARSNGVPAHVRRQAATSAASSALLRNSVGKVRRLCDELGLLSPPSRALWRAVGLWEEPGAPVPEQVG